VTGGAAIMCTSIMGATTEARAGAVRTDDP